MMTGYQEFENKVLKRYGHKKMKVTNSWGAYDAFKHMRKNKWYNIGRPVKENEFYKIIRSVNKLLANEIANGNTVVFPYRMGKLELRKVKRGVSIVNGKMRITYPVDWHSTLKLWYEDEEAKKNKSLIRHEAKEDYSIKYSKFAANYTNMIYYEFDLNRYIRLNLRDNITKGKIESLW